MDEELQKLLDELQKLTEGQTEQPKQEQLSKNNHRNLHLLNHRLIKWKAKLRLGKRLVL